MVECIIDKIDVCKKLLVVYSNAIATKKDKVYTPYLMTANGLFNEIDSLNTLLSQLEKKRLAFNSAIKQRTAILKELIELNKKIAYGETIQDFRAYKKQRKAYKAARADADKKLKILNSKKEELKDLNQRKQDVGLAINSINNALDYVFFEKGRLSIELRDNKYYLKSNGNNVRPKDVSLGERNIIALCYFFTQIVSNQDIARLYQQEELIVIDDPVSSFDFENKVGILSFLRYQINRIVKGNVNSKIILLSHDLATIFDFIKALTEICNSRKGRADLSKLTFSQWELKGLQLNRFEGRRSEYATLLKDEKQRTARDVLCFIYLLNSNHLYAYLKDISGAIDIIKLWSEQIPKNNTFEKLQPIEQNTLKTVQLFDLPLSAGLGNNIMEGDIPYEPYNTENQACDFALKISGNSMEPDIPNGSIVLIKSCNTLENGEIGAFYYNGDIYCKKILYKDERTFLVSLNSDFKEIAISDEDTLYTYGKVISIDKGTISNS